MLTSSRKVDECKALAVESGDAVLIAAQVHTPELLRRWADIRRGSAGGAANTPLLLLCYPSNTYITPLEHPSNTPLLLLCFPSNTSVTPL